MRTARSSTSWGGLHQAPWTRHPPDQAPRRPAPPPLGPGTPQPDPCQLRPWLWACTRSTSIPPLAMGLDQIPLNSPLAMGLDQIPLNFPLGCGCGPDPPQFTPWLWAWTRFPSTSPLNVGLETPPLRPAARYAGIPPAINAG